MPEFFYIANDNKLLVMSKEANHFTKLKTFKRNVPENFHIVNDITFYAHQ